jgi:anaerobic magnesium-protoporphyrin IX monomethyl ester cyclase
MEPWNNAGNVKFLLIGPYDPHCGEYTFLAPPLGVWRIAGSLRAHGIETHVFDPNCCDGGVTAALESTLRSQSWDLIGLSTTAMTLRHDLSLAHLAKRLAPGACLVAGGMEATFKPERAFELGPPFDLIVLGEGEKPLLEIAARLQVGARLDGIPGTAVRANDGTVVRFRQTAMTGTELSEAIRATPYERMPYRKYWDRLEKAYEVGRLPYKADREARLAEIRAMRMMTLNYCPMACSFCASTNFLREAQGSVPRVARLDAAECLAMLEHIVATHPEVRTVIFQDDIFVFTRDERVVPLCDAIIAAKAHGQLPRDLQFISTNRIDAMSAERLAAMRRAGFRVLGFGVENFSRAVLSEFNKSQIHRHIEPVLQTALQLGITPFLDLILTSPRSTLADLVANVRDALHWLAAGCEVGIYPYVIPFSGAAIASDASLEPHTVYETVSVPETDLVWRQAAKILPADPRTRDAILEIEEQFTLASRWHASRVAHLPSRVRSVLWLQAARRVLNDAGEEVDFYPEALPATA